MRGSSKVIMGATIALVIILVVVLGLVLVLLAELYCSLLLRRRKLKAAKSSLVPENLSVSNPQETQGPSPLSSFYAQGVLDAPRSFLFPKLPSKTENQVDSNDIERLRHGKLHEFLRVQSPPQIGLSSSYSSPSPYLNVTKLQLPNKRLEVDIEAEDQEQDIEACSGRKTENLMYISNPIYDNEVTLLSRVNTPFETPDSSPSRMDNTQSGSSGDEKGRESGATSSPNSLPLSPIKELPAKACSVVLKNPRSLGTSTSDSNTQIGRSSTSSSATPCTSPSW